MHLARLILSILTTSLLALTLRGAVPEKLTLADLQGHPERWPWTLPLPKDMKTSKGWKIPKGKITRFVELKGDVMILELDTDLRYTVPVADSDLLSEANKLWAKLTPEQRAIDVPTLAADPSLWPERVKVLEEMNISNEWGRISPGKEFPLLSCEADGVQIGRDDLPRCPVILDARSTDLVERARARALIPPEKRSSRLVEALQGRLINAQGNSLSPETLAQTQIFAFYFGASWCNPCKQFSPLLVKTISPQLASNPHLTVVFLSNDKTTTSMLNYMQAVQMPWPGVKLENWSKLPLLMSYACGTVPQLLILDRHGRVLANSIQGERYIGPRPALQELVRLLGTGVAR